MARAGATASATTTGVKMLYPTKDVQMGTRISRKNGSEEEWCRQNIQARGVKMETTQRYIYKKKPVVVFSSASVPTSHRLMYCTMYMYTSVGISDVFYVWLCLYVGSNVQYHVANERERGREREREFDEICET